MATPSPLGHPAPGPTCQRVDQAAGQQGQPRNQGPVGEALVPHAAVDGDRGLMTLEDRTCSSAPPDDCGGVTPQSWEVPKRPPAAQANLRTLTSGVLYRSQKDRP